MRYPPRPPASPSWPSPRPAILLPLCWTRSADTKTLMPAPDLSAAERVPERRRTTVRQRVVLDVLGRSDRFRSAQQLHAELHSGATIHIGLTSVYRILHRLTEQRLVESQRVPLSDPRRRRPPSQPAVPNLWPRRTFHARGPRIRYRAHRPASSVHRCQSPHRPLRHLSRLCRPARRGVGGVIHNHHGIPVDNSHSRRRACRSKNSATASTKPGPCPTGNP